MKIVFTSTGKSWDSPLDSVFGRAGNFVLYDEKSGNLSWTSNDKNKNAGHGAGIQAGQTVIDMGADVVITGGDVGPKATEVLMKSGITIYKDFGNKTVRQAYESFKYGELELIDSK